MQVWDLFSNFRLLVQICKVCKLAHISKTAARRAKISLISTPPPPEVEREYICNFGTFLQILDFMPKYGNFDN